MRSVVPLLCLGCYENHNCITQKVKENLKYHKNVIFLNLARAFQMKLQSYGQKHEKVGNGQHLFA